MQDKSPSHIFFPFNCLAIETMKYNLQVSMDTDQFFLVVDITDNKKKLAISIRKWVGDFLKFLQGR